MAWRAADVLPSRPVAFRLDSVRSLGKAMVHRGRKTAPMQASEGLSASRHEDPPEGRLSIRRWYDLAPRLPGQLAIKSTHGLESRRFIEAVLWVAATDSTWSQLPKVYGNFHVVYQRFVRWTGMGVWELVDQSLQGDPRLPGLQRLVRQQKQIEARRGKRTANVQSADAGQAGIGLVARLDALEAKVLEMEERLLAMQPAAGSRD